MRPPFTGLDSSERRRGLERPRPWPGPPALATKGFDKGDRVAHFRTTINTRASARKAFEYVADFSNARLWDPSVSAGRRLDTKPLGEGSRFEIELKAPGRPLVFDYEILRYEPHRLVTLCANTPMLRSLDTIEIEPTRSGCRVHYDADLRPRGAYYLLDLPLHLAFQVSGNRSAQGLARALDRLL